MSASKTLLLFVWLLCVVSFFLPADFRAASIGRSLFWLMLILHAIECVAFRSTLRVAPGGFSHNVMQTMVFGLFHLREVRSPGGAPPDSE